MRKIYVIPFICMVSLFCCRFVKSINDTNIHDKSIEESADTKTTTIVAEITENAKTTRKATRKPVDVTKITNFNSTIQNSLGRADTKNPSRRIFFNENIKDYWINIGSSIKDELIDVQAIIVKDEELTTQCQTTNMKPKIRYLVCSGSILSDHHVLTSASCLHEAIHIRHNVRGPLAVVVAPMKIDSQIIQVQDYVIHPNHQENPYDSNYLEHNLAILRLACRIKAHNMKKVQLPDSPFTEMCSDKNCMVALFRKIDKSSYQMQERTAENIRLSKRKRDQNAVLRSSKVSNVTSGWWTDKKRDDRKIRKLIYPPRFDRSFVAIGSDRVKLNLQKNSRNIDNTKKANTQSTIVSTTGTAITEENTRKVEAMETIDKSIINNDSVKSLMPRASDGTNYCPQTGSPVMYGKIQTAIVSVPCDDRQPWRQWGYTDLFVNIDWIKDMVENWKDLENPAGDNTGTGVCNTCIFNFYFLKYNDEKYERAENPDYNKVITIAKKDKGKNENVMQTIEIRISSEDNNNPIDVYSNSGTPTPPALPTAQAAAPMREYRSNAKSIEQSPSDDRRRSTMEKCGNVTGNCAPEADILDTRLSGKMGEIKKASEIRDNNSLKRMTFFNIQNQEKSIRNQSQRDIYANGQAYRNYIDKEPNVVPEASKTVFPLSGGKFENQIPDVPDQSRDNRAMNFQSVAPPLDAANATLFNSNLRGFFEDPKKWLNYPKIVENSKTNDTNHDHVIVVKLRIEEPHYDPSKTSSEAEEAILKNMSVTIDGDRSKNSEIYVNGKSLKNSEIYVYGEKTRNSRRYRKNKDFRYSPRSTRFYQIDRTTDKSTTWTKDRIARLPSSIGHATEQERQSYVVNNGTMETRNDNNEHPGRAMEFSNNVANLPTVRKQDLHVLLRKNRQRGED